MSICDEYKARSDAKFEKERLLDEAIVRLRMRTNDADVAVLLAAYEYAAETLEGISAVALAN